MKMNFIVLSNLLNACSSLLIAGYSFLFFNLYLLIINIPQINSLNIYFSLIVIIVGLIHHYIAIRVKFDANLLKSIYFEINQQPIEQLTKQLDQSLLSLKLIPQNKASRHWDLRFLGCQKLLKLQISLFIFQILLFIFTLFLLEFFHKY